MTAPPIPTKLASAVECESLGRGFARVAGGLVARSVGCQRWIVTEEGDTEPLWVRGRREFSTLTELVGAVGEQMGRLPRG